MKLIKGRKIWDRSRIPDRSTGRIEFPSLIQFKGHWYCAFREAEIHNNHPSGRARLIRSSDGGEWETVRIFDWDCGDVREPKFSITAEGWLMINTSIYFVSPEPRPTGPRRSARGEENYTPPEARKAWDTPDTYYQLDWLGTCLNLPDHDREPHVTQQSVTWLSPDGVNWSAAHAGPEGINTWLWDVTWHNGMGYSLSQWGKDPHGTLYRTRDGRSWRALKTDFGPEGRCNEGALAFGEDGTAYCLFRDGVENVMLGIGTPPYYQAWAWHPLMVDYGPEHGGPQPARDILGTSLGGPNMIRLRDGRLIGAGRALGPGRDDGHATLFVVDPAARCLTLLAEMEGTSYPGLAESDGSIWVTYIGSQCHADIWEVELATVPVA